MEYYISFGWGDGSRTHNLVVAGQTTAPGNSDFKNLMYKSSNLWVILRTGNIVNMQSKSLIEKWVTNFLSLFAILKNLLKMQQGFEMISYTFAHSLSCYSRTGYYYDQYWSLR